MCRCNILHHLSPIPQTCFIYLTLSFVILKAQYSIFLFYLSLHFQFNTSTTSLTTCHVLVKCSSSFSRTCWSYWIKIETVEMKLYVVLQGQLSWKQGYYNGSLCMWNDSYQVRQVRPLYLVRKYIGSCKTGWSQWAGTNGQIRAWWSI